MFRTMLRLVAEPPPVRWVTGPCRFLAGACVVVLVLCACWTISGIISDVRFLGRSLTTDSGVTVKKERVEADGGYLSRSWYVYVDHHGERHEHVREYVFTHEYENVQVDRPLPTIEYLRDDPDVHRFAHHAGIWVRTGLESLVALAAFAALRLMPSLVAWAIGR